ncbi:hypothetical protein GCM10022223_70070 [Kineosporia mesophila]|uniref:Uncharacterized protein n=1 Tax=Kineosporia mesophila TaxID=566012 RepID=A0ABP7AUD9_9ACTN
MAVSAPGTSGSLGRLYAANSPPPAVGSAGSIPRVAQPPALGGPTALARASSSSNETETPAPPPPPGPKAPERPAPTYQVGPRSYPNPISGPGSI